MPSRTAILIALSIVVGCSKSEGAAPSASSAPSTEGFRGCTKDIECKGDRVCEAGRCVDRPATATPSPSTSAVAASRPIARTLSPPKKSIATVAGLLDVVERDPMRSYEIRLNSQTILKASDATGDPHDAGPSPSFTAMFENAAGFDQVVVVRWEGPGNACNGYGFTFLGLARDGSHELSPNIDFCGGPEPTIKLDGDSIDFVVPDAPPNRGTGIVKGQRWRYAGRRLSRRS